MDPRRFLNIAVGGMLLSGCAIFRPDGADFAATSQTAPVAMAAGAAATLAEASALTSMAGVDPEALQPKPTETSEEAEGTPYLSSLSKRPEGAPARGSDAADAEQDGEPSLVRDHRIGAVQVFGWTPGRVYEVRTAPLRVTTLTLGPGETLVAKAAGDTVRWQIGETTSGSGALLRTHVLLKPLARGLETNLILTTNRRVYYLDLRSGSVDRFNPAVAWQEDAEDVTSMAQGRPPSAEPLRIADPVVMPDGPLDARYRISPQGRRPRWTPASVFNDGQRTFIAFNADLQIDEAPTLFVIASDGERQMTNYRQAGGLFIVDRVFDRAELRLGDRRPQIVRLQRLQGGRP